MANVDQLFRSQFGQQGSIFTDADGEIKPPNNKVFVAIQFVADTTLDASTGLVSDTGNDGLGFPGTNASIHDGSTQAAVAGTGGDAIDASTTFPAGLTIYGRWTSINIATSGALIAYIGN